MDGGASANDLLCQLQADQVGVEVQRPELVETTALGAAFLAGLGTGVWSSTDDLRETWQLDRAFTPAADRGRGRRGARPLDRRGRAVEGLGQRHARHGGAAGPAKGGHSTMGDGQGTGAGVAASLAPVSVCLRPALGLAVGLGLVLVPASSALAVVGGPDRCADRAPTAPAARPRPTCACR